MTAGLVSVAGWAEPLKILFSTRAPYYVVTENGTFDGLVSGPVSWAFEKAGIETEWVVTSPKRQLETIRQNKSEFCSPGWFKKPEREAFGKFSEPVYQDKPQIILMRQNVRDNLSHEQAAALIMDMNYRIGVRLGYSYGKFFDPLIATHGDKAITTSQDQAGMLKMLKRERFDYMITTPEELQVLSDSTQKDGHDLVAVEFPDVPAGNLRYLICSQSVSDETMAAFNKALGMLKDELSD